MILQILGITEVVLVTGNSIPTQHQCPTLAAIKMQFLNNSNPSLPSLPLRQPRPSLPPGPTRPYLLLRPGTTTGASGMASASPGGGHLQDRSQWSRRHHYGDSGRGGSSMIVINYYKEEWRQQSTKCYISSWHLCKKMWDQSYD